MAVATVQIRRQTNKPGYSARNRGSCSSVSGIRRPTAAKRPADGLCGQSMQANHARNWFKHRLPNLFARGERLAVGNAFVALDRARRARSVIALGLIKRNGRVKALRIPALCRGFSHTADSGFHPRGAFSFHFYLA